MRSRYAPLTILTTLLLVYVGMCAVRQTTNAGRVERYLLSENWQAALPVLDRLVARDSGDVEARVNRAIVRANLGDWSSALTDIEAAALLRGNLADIYQVRSAVLLHLGRLEEALEASDSAIKLRPDFARGYGQRGNVRTALGQLQLALADHDTAIVRAPRVSILYVGRSVTRRLIGDLQGALADCDEAVWRDRRSADAHLQRGLTLLLLARQAEADEAFQLFVALEPGGRAGLERAVLEAKQGRPPSRWPIN